MGLIDILNGMQAGPRGARQSGGGSGSGMSPVSIALLGLLAYKAVKSFGGSKPATGQAAQAPTGGAETTGTGLGDALGRLFGASPSGTGSDASPGASAASPGDSPFGGLGNLLGGAGAGTLLSGGLSTLINEFEDRGHGEAVQSWVGKGANKEIAPQDLAHALGADTLDVLTQKTGMNRADLLSALSKHLPELIDQLTPEGRLPTTEEASQMV